MIVDTAVQIASVRGLGGLTIGRLAAATAKTKGGICAHFPTKTELQLEVVKRAEAMFRDAVVEPALAAPAGWARLERLIDSWFAYIERRVFEGGCFFTNAALEFDDLDEPEVMAEIRRLYTAYLCLLESCVEKARSRGELAAETEPAQIALLLQGLEAAALVRHALGDADAYPTAHAAAHALLEQNRP